LEQIGKYRALEKIGQGATSTVYKGYDDALGRYVAIKAISAESGGDETLRKRFEREAQSAARLAHPHIITVYDFGQEQDKLYMAMELLEGVDLKQAIAENRLPSLDQKLDVMEQICDGLAFAHAHEIVHRDLKPANIRLLADDQVKIMDFGLARHAGSDMTRTGLVMGTPYYMSPEQMRGEHVDTRSDVFSLGCVFYELITGQKPFEAESLHSVLYKVLQSNPKSPKEVVKDLPGVVVQLLDRALAKDRNLRFANGEEFLRAVQEAREAVASGRGDEPLAGLEPPTMLVAPPPAAARPQPKPPAPEAVAPAPTEASRSSTASSVRRTGSAPSFTSSRVGRPLPPRRRSNATLFAGLGAVTVAILIVGALLVGRGGSTPPPQAVASSASGELGALVATEVEIARRRLASGDYEEALRRAERALRFDPRDESAQKVQKDARAIKDRVDEALGGVKTAKSGDAAAAGAALWKLLEVAPDHAATAELLPALDSAYKGRAEEARRLMAAARGSAEKTPAQRLPAFAEGQSLVTAAESSFRAGRFAEAARDFMRARARFEAADRLSH
jgi:serine/threonine-protein kinase